METKIAKEVTVIPNKYLKLSNLAEHSYVPFGKDTSEMDDTLLPGNVQKYELNKPTKSVHEGQSKEDWIEANLADGNYLALCETELKYEETESTIERVISIEYLIVKFFCALELRKFKLLRILVLCISKMVPLPEDFAHTVMACAWFQ